MKGKYVFADRIYPICDCSWTDQRPYTGQITEIAPYVCTYIYEFPSLLSTIMNININNFILHFSLFIQTHRNLSFHSMERSPDFMQYDPIKCALFGILYLAFLYCNTGMVLISDGYSEHVTHVWRNKGSFMKKKNQISNCCRSNQSLRQIKVPNSMRALYILSYHLI